MVMAVGNGWARFWRDVLNGQGRCVYLAKYLLNCCSCGGYRALGISVPVDYPETVVIVEVSCFRDKGLLDALCAWVEAFPTRVLCILPYVVRNGDKLVDRLKGWLGVPVVGWRSGCRLGQFAPLPLAELLPAQLALLLVGSPFVHRMVYRLLHAHVITVSRYTPAAWVVSSTSWSGFVRTLHTFLKTPQK